MMRPRRKSLSLIWGGFLGLAIILRSSECRADGVILHLRNGDRIAGTILSETTNQLTLSNAWTKDLVVPLSQIERRESPTNGPSGDALPPTNYRNVVATNAPPLPLATTNQPAATNTTLAAKPVSPAVAVPPPPPPKLPWYKHWKGEILIGTSLIKGATDTELFYGKSTFTYTQPYLSDPKLVFRNIFTYTADYGKTAGVLSANDMSGGSKTDFDLNPRLYLYNLGAAGYDEIRSINLHYEDGPGAGYHLFKQTNFLANLETGVNYQVDEQTDGTIIRSFFYRFAEDFNWKINKQTSLVEKYDFYPRADLRQYRSRFESTLSYAFMQNVSFNMAVIDLYDTAPAPGVPKNELQFRTSLGVKF